MQKAKSQKILVFGGAFNPPTTAHEAIIQALLDLPGFDEVWILVSGDRLDKYMDISDEHRMRMVELIKKDRFADDPRLKVSDFELNMPRPTQTFQTSTALEQAYPGVEFWFVFGADSYNSILSWPHGAELRNKLTKIVLFSRSDQQAETTAKVIRLQISDAFKDVSSSELRRMAASGTSLRGMVSSIVADYIARHQLYRQSD